MADFRLILAGQWTTISCRHLDAKLTPTTGPEALNWVDWEGCNGSTWLTASRKHYRISS